MGYLCRKYVPCQSILYDNFCSMHLDPLPRGSDVTRIYTKHKIIVTASNVKVHKWCIWIEIFRCWLQFHIVV